MQHAIISYQHGYLDFAENVNEHQGLFTWLSR
jgi:hypothetical protein